MKDFFQFLNVLTFSFWTDEIFLTCQRIHLTPRPVYENVLLCKSVGLSVCMGIRCHTRTSTLISTDKIMLTIIKERGNKGEREYSRRLRGIYKWNATTHYFSIYSQNSVHSLLNNSSVSSSHCVFHAIEEGTSFSPGFRLSSHQLIC